MTPTQRTAALRLAKYWEDDSWPGGLSGEKMDETAALLRELAVEPEPNPFVGTMAEQLLQVIAGIWTEHPDYSLRQTLEALNALMLPAEPVQEPVDCGEAGHADGRCGNASCCAKPVAWMGVHDRTDLFYRKPSQVEVIPLYVAPQQRKPLAENFINDLGFQCGLQREDARNPGVEEFARLIEAAHGIKETP